MEDWQRPIPVPGDPLWNRLGACDLGPYLQHPDGTLEALPSHYRPGMEVRYQPPMPDPTVDPDAPLEVLPGRVVMMGGPYPSIMTGAPQPAPHYTHMDRFNRQRPAPGLRG